MEREEEGRNGFFSNGQLWSVFCCCGTLSMCTLLCIFGKLQREFFFSFWNTSLKKFENWENETFTEHRAAGSATGDRQLLFVHYHGGFACGRMLLRFW